MRRQQESLPENSEKSTSVEPQTDFAQTDFAQPADWHWIEIEGEATTLPLGEPRNESLGESLESSTSLASTALAATQLPAEQSDDTVVASLAERQIAVNPGGTATLQTTLLNNGNRAARFRLQCDSDLDDEWLDPLDQSILLQPGESTVLEITIRPPRSAAARAGEYPFSLCADAAEYPGRYTELHAAVTVNPFRDLAVGAVQLQSPSVNAFRRSVRLAVPIHNLGNIPTSVQVSGYEQERHFRYRFANSPENQQHSSTLLLEPGQSAWVQAIVRPLHRAWVGAQPHPLRPALLFQIAEEARAPRVAAFSLYDLPLFGIWTLAGLAAAIMVMGIGIIAAGVIAAGIWWVRQMPTQPQTIFQQVSAPPQSAQPIVVVVPMNRAAEANPSTLSQSVGAQAAAAQAAVPQPNSQMAILPSPTPEPLRNSATFNSQGALALTAPLVIENGANSNVPIITAADISQPNAQQAPALSAQPAAFAPQSQSVASQPADLNNAPRLTYAQMFQEIALRYDLNWRMLAAQAYIESGFDSLALGKNGDMGLMQILPGTWQEFAPRVNVKDPFESYSNTLVAATYLDYLRTKLGEKGYPQQEWMLVAYNWGPDRVIDFLASGGNWETLDAQRRKYAEEILRITATIP